MNCGPNRAHDRDNISVLSEGLDTKQTFELLKGNGNSSAGHKANNGSMRKEVNEEA